MKREIDLGVLSAAEASAGVRAHYVYILEVTKHAGRELSVALAEGLPNLDPKDAAARDAHRRMWHLINTFVWGNRSLWSAAQSLQATEKLPEGELVMEVLL